MDGYPSSLLYCFMTGENARSVYISGAKVVIISQSSKIFMGFFSHYPLKKLIISLFWNLYVLFLASVS